MTAKIIDGNKLASEIRESIKKKVKKLNEKPGLAVVIVGENPASKVYVGMKEKDSKEVGFHSVVKKLKDNINEVDLVSEVDKLNQDPKIHGMIVQLPLPKQINPQMIIDSILPHKDADGFTVVNMGNLFIGNNVIVSATPKGVMKLIESTGVNLEGKHAVVVGRSNIVGKPISILLQQKHCTVTMCHSRSNPLEKYTKEADILIAAVGRPKMITGDMIKPGAIVIDVGINRVDGKLVGDVDFESAKKVAGHITPVPGGVGPMTRAMLLENTLECMRLAPK